MTLSDQYRSSANLDARIRLHLHYSTNPYGWQRWIFDQFDLPPSARVLEIGCGPGNLWLDNLDRIPPGWEVLLTDQSPGMLEQAQRNLARKGPFRFRVVDASRLPLPFHVAAYDAVIANHMIYHLPDRPGFLAEVRRVLKPGGKLYASTIGERHMAELHELTARFGVGPEHWNAVTHSFTLENGEGQLTPWFGQVETRRYPDALEVTETNPLVDYILSWPAGLPADRVDALPAFVAAELDRAGGVIRITKDSGLFVCVREG